MAISGSGIGSGIDIRGLVDDLLKAEGEAKSAKFDSDEADALSKITGFGTLKSAMNDFQGSLSNLKDINSFQTRSATSQDEDVFTVIADKEAVAGSYSIEVTQLATNHKLTSTDFADVSTVVGSGTLKFHFGTVEHSINISSGNDTLSDIRNTINDSSSDTGVQASIVTTDTGSKLVLTSLDKGVSEVFTVSVVDDADTNDTDNAGLSQLASTYSSVTTTAVDSIVQVDGATVTTSSNSLETVIDGVTIDLVSTNIGDPKTLTVALDKNAARASVETFVTSYNAVMDTINDLTLYQDGGFEASTGILIGDSLLRNVEFQVRKQLNTAMNTVTGFRTAAEVGITTNEITGKLELSNTKLTEALESNFDAVGDLFANDTEGLAVRMDELLETYIQSNGLIESRINGLNTDIEDISVGRVDLERRLQQMESRLLGQFIAMDSIIAKLNQTSSFLTQQLDSLPQPLAFKK